MTTGRIQAAAEFATVQRAGIALAVYDTAELVSKADPTAEIASQFGRRTAEFIDNQLMLEAAKSPNTTNITGVGSGIWDQNTGITAMIAGLGDNYAKMLGAGRYIMHSKVLGDLLKTGAIQNQYQSGMDTLKTGMLPYLNGVLISVSDLVTVTVVSGVPHYTTFIVGPDALSLMYQRNVLVEFDRDILLRADIMTCSVDFAAHLEGWDDQGNALAAEQAKSVHVVTVVSL